MHLDLAHTIALINESRETLAAQAIDDQRKTALVDFLARLSDEQFVALQDLITDKANAAMRSKARMDHMVYELANLGWMAVLESMQQRVADSEEEAA